MSRRATPEELQRCWSLAEQWYEQQENSIKNPWTRAGFCLKTFKLILRQKDLRVHLEDGGASIR